MTIVVRPRRLTYAPDDRRKDMVPRLVEDLLRRVEAQSVEVVLVDPVTGIGEEELAHGPRVGGVEIDRSPTR